MGGPVRAADPSKYRLAVEIPVRFRDTDGMGHVNNAVYLTYIEVARERYWREVFGLVDYRKVDIILARVEIDFVSPAHAGETVVVGVRASALGRKSFDFEYEGWAKGDGRLVVTARSVQVMYDYEKGASKEPSADFRRKILEFEGPGTVSAR